MLSLGLLALLAWRVDPGAVATAIAGVVIWPVFVAQVTKLAGFCFLACRTRLLVVQQELSMRGALAAHLVGFAGNNLLPARGGELLRVDHLARRSGVPYEVGFTVVVIERSMDLLVVALLLLVSVPLVVWQLDLAGHLVTALGVSSALVGTLAALGAARGRLLPAVEALSRRLPKRVRSFILARARSVLGALTALQSPRRGLGVLAATVGYWVANAAGVALYLSAFQLGLPARAPLVVLLFAAFGSAIPAAPSAAGTYHYFVVQALLQFDVLLDVALASALVMHLGAFLPYTLVGLPLLVTHLVGVTHRPFSSSRSDQDAALAGAVSEPVWAEARAGVASPADHADEGSGTEADR